MASISIDVETKPNNCSCYCGICGKEIKKGEKRFNLSCEGWKVNKNCYFHLTCLPGKIQKLAAEGDGGWSS